MGFIIIYVTHESYEEAKKIGEELVSKKMVACANYFPIKSTFFWEGNVEGEDEYVSLLKTKSENWNKVKKEVKKLHPYDTPAIIKFEVESNEEYEEWIKDNSNA